MGEFAVVRCGSVAGDGTSGVLILRRTLRHAIWVPPPPPLAHARSCLSTGWALNRRFKEILRPLFLWSRMEDWVFVERLYRERGAQSCL